MKNLFAPKPRYLQARFLAAVLLCFGLFLPFTARAQSDSRVSLQCSNASLKSVIDKIEGQTAYRFIFNKKILTDAPPVTAHLNDVEINKALDTIFAGKGISYTIDNNRIVLKHTPGAATQGKATASRKITGTVMGLEEDGEPLIAATVTNKTTGVRVMTNVDGEFTIKADRGQSLTVSYVGYEPKTVKVGDADTYKIGLQPSSSALSEMVVIGYGRVKKTDLTGSVSTVKMTDIKDNPVLSVDQALQGRVPGADIMSSSGDPGATTQIRIRGTRSISASNEPLIVVDGVMDAVHDLKDINMSDIASVSVLKDASSTAIYGSRGANGVIIITTKQGQSNNGKPSVTFKADVGFSQLPRGLDVMDASEYAQYRNDYAFITTNDGYGSITTGTPQNKYPYPDPKSYGKGTDWVDEITRTAPQQSYNLSISGRGEKSSYFASIGYNDTRGIIDDSGLTRINGRLNLDYNITKWLKVGYKGTYAHFDQDCNKASIGGTSWYSAALYLSPMIKAEDNFNPLWNGGQKFNTPRATIDLNTHIMPRYSMTHTVSFDIKLGKHFLLRSQESYYQYDRETYRYYPSTLPRKTEDEGGEAYRSSYNQYRLSTENTLSFNHKIGKNHHIDALVGFTAYKQHGNTLSLNGKGYMVDGVLWNNMNAVLDKETYEASTSLDDKKKVSFLGRVNYNFKQRYYLTLTGRYDGASNFASNNKWAFFPSGALKWNVANEEFLKNVDWIEELSLRLSAGRSGNDAISTYRSLATMGSSTSGYLFGGSQPAAYYRSRLASPDLTWEKTDLYNVATDLSFLHGRINLTAEAYLSKTTDLLLTVQTPAHTGYTSRFENIGKTSNKGVELTIDTHNITTRKFSWSTTFTIAHNEQMVDEIGQESFVVAMQSSGTNKYMMNGYMKGYPLNALWGFHYAGVWHNVDELKRNEITHAYVSENKIPATAYESNLGIPRFIDMNHDGALTQDDLCYLGNADPVLYGGLQNTFRFGNLNLSMYWNYSIGGKIYNYTEYWMAGSTGTNQYRYMLDSWHPVRNPNSDYPRAGCISTWIPNDFMVHDASYLRLKNITIGYTFNMPKSCKWLSDIYVSASGENLWLWKKYNGFDPDVSTDDSSSLRRVDMGAYPKCRTFVFSVQLHY